MPGMPRKTPIVQETQLGKALDTLLAQSESDADMVYRQLMGGDLETDTVDIPPDKYDEYRWENWTNPTLFKEWADSMLPEDWLDEVLRIGAPDLSAPTKKKYIDMLEAGVPAMEATKIANEMHVAEQMLKHLNDPAPPLTPLGPPTTLPAQMAPAPGFMAPPAAVPGGM